MRREQRLEQKEQRPTMNLLADPFIAVEAIAQIEGPGWLEEQDKIQVQLDQAGADPAAVETIAHDTLPGALAHLQDLGTADLTTDPHKIYTIYGNGGINRWYVYSDGAVKFSESHAQSPDHVVLAQRAGFEIAS